MSNFQRPPIAPYFVVRSWNLANEAELRDELQKAIVEDPEIQSKADISVDAVTEGARVSEIHLIGSVASDKEKDRAKEIVAVNTKNEVKIVNELVVK